MTKNVTIDTTSGRAIVRIVKHKNSYRGMIKLVTSEYEQITLDCISPVEVKHQAVRILKHVFGHLYSVTIDSITWE